MNKKYRLKTNHKKFFLVLTVNRSAFIPRSHSNSNVNITHSFFYNSNETCFSCNKLEPFCSFKWVRTTIAWVFVRCRQSLEFIFTGVREAPSSWLLKFELVFSTSIFLRTVDSGTARKSKLICSLDPPSFLADFSKSAVVCVVPGVGVGVKLSTLK